MIWIVIVGIAVVAGGVVFVIDHRDRARMSRGEAAGRLAAEQYRLKEAMRPPPAVFKAQIVDHGADHRPRSTRWKWLIWDSEPDYEGGQVEGAIVPYALGDERSRVAAERAAHDAFVKWLDTQPDKTAHELVYNYVTSS